MIEGTPLRDSHLFFDAAPHVLCRSFGLPSSPAFGLGRLGTPGGTTLKAGRQIAINVCASRSMSKRSLAKSPPDGGDGAWVLQPDSMSLSSNSLEVAAAVGGVTEHFRSRAFLL